MFKICCVADFQYIELARKYFTPLNRTVLSELKQTLGVSSIDVDGLLGIRKAGHRTSRDVRIQQAFKVLQTWEHVRRMLGLDPTTPPTSPDGARMVAALDWMYACGNKRCPRTRPALKDDDDTIEPSMRCARCYVVYCSTVRRLDESQLTSRPVRPPTGRRIASTRARSAEGCRSTATVRRPHRAAKSYRPSPHRPPRPTIHTSLCPCLSCS